MPTRTSISFPIVEYPITEGSLVSQALAQRLAPPSDALEAAVREAYAQVTAKGVQAIVEYTVKHDHPGFAEKDIFVSQEDVASYVRSLTPALRSAIDCAVANVSTVNKHIAESLTPWKLKLSDGHTVGERVHPFETVLLWTPARKGPLVSTAIMLCTAAAAAGVQRIIVATPPTHSGKPDANTLAAAHLAGATDFVCGNGLAVIASAAIGNWELGKANAIFGPGPDAIALAMLQASRYGVATQPGVGPSDALVVLEDISDKEADILARDFLTEIEHGSDSRTYALTVDRRSAERLQNALNIQTANLFGHEATYAEIAANGNAAIVVFSSAEEVVSFANAFASEHLMLYVDPPHREKYLDGLTAVGELLIGKSTPFTAANYCIGVTHVLPTSGFARAYSGITSRQFVRHTTTAELEPSALRRLLPTVEAIGAAEGLPNHVQAVKARQV